MKKHSPRPWHSLQTDSRCFSITYPLPLHATQTISASWKTAPMEPSKESLNRTAASYDLPLLRLYVDIKIRKRMTTTNMKAPNRSEFSKTSFMIGFRMPFNSRYQPLYHVASYTSLLQGWNTDHFPEVFVAIIHDTENCCPMRWLFVISLDNESALRLAPIGMPLPESLGQTIEVQFCLTSKLSGICPAYPPTKRGNLFDGRFAPVIFGSSRDAVISPSVCSHHL